MEILLLLLPIIVLIFVLIKSANLVEESFVFLAKKLKLNEVFVGFAILGILTSLPEISVAIQASQEAPTLSLGNLFGAQVVLLTLVIGLSAIKYRGIKLQKRFKEKEIITGLILIFLGVSTTFDFYISVLEGVFLIFMYAMYILYLNKALNGSSTKKHVKINIKKLFHLFIKSFVGVFFLIIASKYIVDLSQNLAVALLIPTSIIGVLLLGFGTNVPELGVLFTAKKEDGKEENLILGNFLGSASANVGILGLLAILSGGFSINNHLDLIPTLTILTLTLILFGIASWSGKVISRVEGFVLIGLYISLLIVEYLTLSKII